MTQKTKLPDYSPLFKPRWSGDVGGYTKEQLQAYGAACAAHARELAQHREQQPVCHGCGIPAGDVHMSTCKSGKWPSRVSNGDTAAPAPAPHTAQPLLAHEVLKLNALWNKSSVKDSAIADQLAVCRVLAESEDDMELTDAQILTLWEETYVQRGWTGIEFARAIERAHGIGVKQ